MYHFKTFLKYSPPSPSKTALMPLSPAISSMDFNKSRSLYAKDANTPLLRTRRASSLLTHIPITCRSKESLNLLKENHGTSKRRRINITWDLNTLVARSTVAKPIPLRPTFTNIISFSSIVTTLSNAIRALI